ncbi:MAG: hypothetical protein ABW352_05760 [Polyangiales bacterium]
MQIRSKFVVSVVSLLGAVACGEDDGGAGGGSGLSDNKKLGDLSESEARSLCKSLQSKFKSLGDSQVELSCTLQSAFTSGGDAARCGTQVDSCKENEASVVDPIDCDGDDAETGVSTDCNDVTVGELNDCIDANITEFDKLASMVTCSTSIQELGSLSMSVETPAACAKIEAKCPDIADMNTPMSAP